MTSNEDTDGAAGAARAGIAALRRSHDNLATFVNGLAPGDLEKPSGAAEWTVAQVLSHLGSGAEIMGDAVQAALDGKPPIDRDKMPAVWARWNAMAPADVARESLETNERLLSTFENIDDDVLAATKVDMGFLPAPVDVATVASLRLSEHALHSWDVYVGFDPATPLADFTVPILLGSLTMMGGFFARPIDRDIQMTLATTAPDRAFALHLTADGGRVTEGEAEGANRATLPAEALIRLASGRLGPDHTPAGVTTTGDVTLDDLRRVFPGY
jgi:uncharacterized protein (TIGR03083 family)